MRLIARVGGALAMIDPIRREMTNVNKRVTVFRTIPLADHLNEAVASDRLTASLVAVCGGIALLMATIGVYGVVAYAVVRRSKEIGIRVALGARPLDVVRLILAEGFSVTGGGLALGLVGAAIAAQALGSLTPLYGERARPHDLRRVPAIRPRHAGCRWPPTRRALRSIRTLFSGKTESLPGLGARGLGLIRVWVSSGSETIEILVARLRSDVFRAPSPEPESRHHSFRTKHWRTF